MRRAVIALLAAVSLATSTGPASANTTRVPYQCRGTLVAQTVDGGWFYRGGVAHLRGSEFVYESEGDVGCAGTYTIQVNFNLGPNSSGDLWGTATLLLDGVQGGFHTTWRAHWTTSDPLSGEATDIWLGSYVGHGFGAMEGWESRGTLLEESHASVSDTGYLFQPGD